MSHLLHIIGLKILLATSIPGGGLPPPLSPWHISSPRVHALSLTHLIPQGDRKGPHPAPHRPRPYYEDERGITVQRIIVRAGAVWSGVGTLAVALGMERERPLEFVSYANPILSSQSPWRSPRPVHQPPGESAQLLHLRISTYLFIHHL